MLTAKDATNWYLYGTDTTPINRIDESLIQLE
jgi:hypothetical protein